MNRVFMAVLCALLPVVVQAAEGEYQRWKRESLQGYQNYRNAQDQEFGNYLAKQWQEFALFKGEKRDDTPKPKVAPVLTGDGNSTPSSDKARPVTQPATPVVQPQMPVLPQPRELLPVQGPQTKAPPEAKGVKLSFFGHQLTLAANSLPAFVPNGVLASAQISEWWQLAANSDHQQQLTSLKMSSERLHLSDWGTYLLVRDYSRVLNGNARNGQVITTWFLLTRLGYSTKIAYSGNELVLLMATRHPLYETKYLTFGNDRYYVIDAPAALGSQLKSYDGTHSKAKNRISMEQSLRMFDGQAANMKRQLAFMHAGKNHQVTIHFAKQTIDYLNTIPPTELSVYFNATQSAALRHQLVEQLRPMIVSLSREQAINLLLAFVQHGFQYATDEQQFGREHYMFADEIFYYPYSDCEDRAVLFAHLVRELLEVDVVGVSYDGHVATAVHLQGVSGRRLAHRNREYLIADPTYINANVGMEMPQYRDATPQLIDVR